MSKKLRSQQWFGGLSKAEFIHRSWMKNQGHPHDVFDGRPVIGICNTFSDFTPCNGHFKELVEFIKRGVYEAGGLPLEFPVFSCSESNARPTAMLFRNLAAMEVEEAIRGLPMDGVVLMVGCDKTTPSLVMGAASCDLPTIAISGGTMLNGKFQGRDIGSGTDVWAFSEDVRGGRMSLEDFMSAEDGMSRSKGHCNTMGTASTMASMVEALGLGLPQNAAIPAADSRRNSLAQLVGRRIVGMVHEDLTLSKILTKTAFENAITVNAGIGGSTNAVVHLIAMARRIGVDLGLDDFDRCGAGVRTFVDLMPSGRFLMEDFYYAGGLPVVIKTLLENGKLDGTALTVNGKTLAENCADARNWNTEVIREYDNPIDPEGGITVLRGNLAPRGAVIKVSAATKSLLNHTGRAVVFETIEDYRERIDDPGLDIDETCVMVLKNCGPKGYPGMAEVGNMGLPTKVLEKGITDMVRISDARMSGTAYGTVVLHTAPEAAAGGPLLYVENGDMIELNVAEKRLELLIDAAELERRKAARPIPEPQATSGYQKMYIDHVLQADEGCDLDFLVGHRGHEVTRESH